MKKLKYLFLLILSLIIITSCDNNINSNVCKHENTKWVIDMEATCTKEGIIHEECKDCEEIIKIEKIEAHHNLVHHEAKDPTCTEDGYEEYDECKNCDYSTYEKIKALGHTESSWIVDNDSTCTSEGLKHTICTVCGEKIKEKYTEELGHNYENGECTRCGLKENTLELDQTKEITVKFWHAFGSFNQQIISEIIDNFEELYPNITVEQSSLRDYTTLRDTIINGIANGELPTIAQAYPDHIATYLKGDAIRDLDMYINSKSLITLSNGIKDIIGLSKQDQEDYIKGFMDECRCYDINNTLYALPFNKSTEVLYYNKTIFDKYGWSVPKTWDDVVAISEAFKETTEYKTLAAAGKEVAGCSYDSEANLFITLTKQWGGEYTKFNSSGKGEFAFTNDAKSKEAITWFKNQYDKGNLATATHFGTNYSSDAFKTGQCIMTIGSSAGAGYNIPSDGSFEVGVASYPQKDLNNAQVIQQGTNVSLFKCKDAQEELAGWLFMKYLTSYESSLLWSTKTNYFPIRKSVLNSDEYKDHISGKLVDSLGNVVYNPTAQHLAQNAALEQQDWFYTNVAFYGSARARDEAELLVQQILYGGISVDNAYRNAYNVLIYG